MAKKINFKRRTAKMQIPLAVLAGFVPLVYTTYKHVQWNGWSGEEGGIDIFIRSLTGFSPNQAYGRSFEFKRMNWGLLPILAGIAAHKIIGGRLGVNAMLSRSGIPLIRI